MISNFRNLATPLKVTILLSIGILVLSFSQPAFYTSAPDPAGWADSWMLFLLGWMGILGGNGIATIIWMANPIYFIAMYNMIKGKPVGIILSFVATLLAFSFSQLDGMLTSESGQYSKITSLELGYMLWLSSFAILSLGALLNKYISLQNRNREEVF